MPPEQLRKWDDSYLGFSFSLSFFFPVFLGFLAISTLHCLDPCFFL